MVHRHNSAAKTAKPNFLAHPRFPAIGAGIAALVIGTVFLTQTESEASLPPLEDTKPVYDLTRFDMGLEDTFTASGEKLSLTLKSGDSLGPLLQNNGLSGPEAYKVTQAFAKVYSPKDLRVGQVFDLYLTDGTLTHLTYRPSVDATIFVSRKEDNYHARKIAAEFGADHVTVRSTIENSLYLDANALGAPDKVIQQFANIYEYSVDFQRDIRPGDAFEMFFEVARDHHGNIVKAGDLLFTSFSPRGKTSSYYLYEDSKGRENFYDEKGKTAKRKLRATPINGARLSSRFGKRRHPILGYDKMHSGIDFAAPRGTPILAAGTGVIERANRFGSYGNYIRIRHTDGYKTAYAHLKNFARGIKKGKRVRQDQVIGYVGTTGRSTGPHLHYEVHLNGKKINPRRVNRLSGKPLSKGEIPVFDERRNAIDSLRATADVLTRPNTSPELLAAQ